MDSERTLIVIGLILCGLVLGCVAPTDPNTTRQQSNGNRPEQQTEIPPSWQYSEYPDEMRRGNIFTASIQSSNAIDLDFPYQRTQRATLTLRQHPQYGKEVFISIERGQLLDSDYNEKAKVRFDDSKLMSFGTSRPSDHSSETLFLRGAFATFLSQLKKAKTVRVEVPIYQGGNQTFVFDVAGFEWKQ